ncbi:MAG TPA: YecR family lipoprotein [Rhizomicrobium sp.]|nr:YecR family lipoprotein [Rhizomicrobium sp.]
MKLYFGAAFAVALIVAGCAVQKELVPTGGSRADGTVNLSFQYGLFEKPEVDMNKASVLAAQRCTAWGYKGAEPFGGHTSKCEQVNGYGNCILTTVTVAYQCTGTAPIR